MPYLVPLIDKSKMIKISFAFVDELKQLKINSLEDKMVSFDITSPYTNIPLDETIEIILRKLYDVSTTNDQPPIKRADFKQLLNFATKNSHFIFNGKIYDQIDGVSMGAPLAPIIAEVFMQELENNISEQYEHFGILYYKRYVDDVFAIINSNQAPNIITTALSDLHPSIKFTYEEETVERTLPFLDILITKTPNGFLTEIYRKPTYTGLMTKWNSFVPKRYKVHAISTMVYRAIKICSTYASLHKEFQFIRNIAIKNGYPITFVDSVIGKHLNKYYNPPISKMPKELTNTENVVLRIPYFGKISEIYGNRIRSAAQQLYPLKKVRIVYDTNNKLGNKFSPKDHIPTEIRSGLVYEMKCPHCDKTYIGKTYRHLKTRVNEHLHDQRKIITTQNKQRNLSCIEKTYKTTAKLPNTKQRPITISQTGKLLKRKIDLDQNMIDDTIACLTTLVEYSNSKNY